jgi:hypothetical protein
MNKGRAQIDLPALDLPVSRTGVELHYSPRYRIELQPGSFRPEDDPGPFAEALRQAPTTTVLSRAPVTDARTVSRDAGNASRLQALVDRFRAEAGARTVAGALPVNVTFPHFGPSMFLASELTPESQAPRLELSFKRK